MRKKKGSNKFAMRGVSKKDLERMYHVENLSQWQIAKKLGVTQGAVFYWMKKYEISSRSHDDSLILFGKSGRFTGEKNPRWSGGRHQTKAGYVMIRSPDHPLADNRGYVKEHRMVWFEANGAIPEKWHIHHKNGDKTDNRLENLELMTHRKHRAVLPDLLAKIHLLETKIEELENELSRYRGRKSPHKRASRLDPKDHLQRRDR